MEPTMISLKVLSSAAAIALVLSLAPTASFAGNHPGGRAGFAARGGGAPAARIGGGGVRMGGGGAVAQFRSGGGGAVAQFHGGGGGAGYRGGGGGYRRGGGGFIPGAVAGAVIGGALDSYAYYGGPGYYAPGYDDGQYYDDGAVAVVPAPVGGDDAVAYCMQTYRSYDPASGTYLGFDGLRHSCP
jgi:hypothetical protein